MKNVTVSNEGTCFVAGIQMPAARAAPASPEAPHFVTAFPIAFTLDSPLLND